MSLPSATLNLENQIAGRSLTIDALVDSGSVFLTVPKHVAIHLGFNVPEGSTDHLIGPLRVRYGDRHCDLSALVCGDDPVIGSVPMAMLDLVLNPTTQMLTVNPSSPFVPVAITK